MKAKIHAATSAFAGALLWFYTRSLYAGILFFISGFLIDVDHIIDYVINCGWKSFTLKRLFLICEQTEKQEGEERFKKVYVIFHAYEIAMVLWIMSIYTKNIYLVAITAGYTMHLLLDSIGNSFYPCSYFMIWRAINDFDAERLFRKERIKI